MLSLKKNEVQRKSVKLVKLYGRRSCMCNRLHFFASPPVVPRRMANPIIDSHVQIFSHAYSRQWPPVIVAALSTDAYKRTVCVTTQSKWFQFTILAAPIESLTKNKSHEITNLVWFLQCASIYLTRLFCMLAHEMRTILIRAFLERAHMTDVYFRRDYVSPQNIWQIRPNIVAYRNSARNLYDLLCFMEDVWFWNHCEKDLIWSLQFGLSKLIS